MVVHLGMHYESGNRHTAGRVMTNLGRSIFCQHEVCLVEGKVACFNARCFVISGHAHECLQDQS